jgi:hypothetical protein
MTQLAPSRAPADGGHAVGAPRPATGGTLAPIDLEGYKPAALADQPAPTLTWIPIDQLVIDRTYQREVSPAGRRAIQRIADGFDWTRFGAIQLAPLEGGRFAIVDGQHRTHAAALCGIETVPAMIVPMSARQQAQGFAAMNRDRIRVDGLQIYRAELAAGVEWAIACRDAVAAADCRLMDYTPSARARKPGNIFAIALIRRMVAAGEGAAVTAGLAAIRRSIQGAQVTPYGGGTLAVWLPAVARNQQFLRLNLAHVFDGIDIETITDDCRHRARQTGGSARPMAIEEGRPHRLKSPDFSRILET